MRSQASNNEKKYFFLSLSLSFSRLSFSLPFFWLSFDSQICPHVVCWLFTERRIVQHDSSLIAPSPGDPTTAGSSTNQMSTSTSNHPQSNSSLFTYRSTPAAATAAGGNINRPRAMPDPTTTNSLLISTDKLKSNMPSSLRSTRQPVVTTTNTTSALMSSQQMQRSTYTNGRSRGQLEKVTPSRGKPRRREMRHDLTSLYFS